MLADHETALTISFKCFVCPPKAAVGLMRAEHKAALTQWQHLIQDSCCDPKAAVGLMRVEHEAALASLDRARGLALRDADETHAAACSALQAHLGLAHAQVRPNCLGAELNRFLNARTE